jgi:hypothetical protein
MLLHVNPFGSKHHFIRRVDETLTPPLLPLLADLGDSSDNDDTSATSLSYRARKMLSQFAELAPSGVRVYCAVFSVQCRRLICLRGSGLRG